MTLSKPFSGQFSGRTREQARDDQKRINRLIELFPGDLALKAVSAFYQLQPARDLEAALLPGEVLAELGRLNVDADVLNAAYQVLDSAPTGQQSDETAVEAATLREELVRYWGDGNAMAWTMFEARSPLRLSNDLLLPVQLASERWQEWKTMMQDTRESLLMTLAVLPDDFTSVLGGFTARLREHLASEPLELPDGLTVVRQADRYLLESRV